MTRAHPNPDLLEVIGDILTPPPVGLQRRFWAKVDRNGPVPEGRPDLGPCWIWLASQDDGGYGQIWVRSELRLMPAHRLSYEWLVGRVPAGLCLDHLCRVRHCVNPAHLEPVTPVENVMRGQSFSAINAAKSHCANGHPFDEDNTHRDKHGHRRCRICKRAKDARVRARRRVRAVLTLVDPCRDVNGCSPLRPNDRVPLGAVGVPAAPFERSARAEDSRPGA